MQTFLKNTVWKFLFEILGWLILMLVVLEMITYLFVFKSPMRVVDPVWGMVPSENSCYRRGTEGFGVTCYAANGEIDTPYHDGKSIVVLGDSYTEALQVDNSEKFVSLAETYLHKRGLEADLHNLGDSGLNIADYVYLAPRINQSLSPEVVVVQVNMEDFRASLDSSYDTHLVQNGEKLTLYHEDDSPNILVQNLIRSSSLLTYLAHRWSLVSPSLVFDSPSVNADANDDSGDSEAETISSDQIVAQVNFLKESYKDSQLVLLVIPNVPIISETGLSWSNPSDNDFVSILQSIDGVEVVYPPDAFQSFYEEEQIFPRGFFNTSPNVGHINEYGHRLIAKSLADSLEEFLK